MPRVSWLTVVLIIAGTIALAGYENIEYTVLALSTLHP
jgi:hypothetical protein